MIVFDAISDFFPQKLNKNLKSGANWEEHELSKQPAFSSVTTHFQITEIILCMKSMM